MSGGSFGGLRSTSTISLRIQIYYSIGFDYSVLPIGRIQFTYIKKGVKIKISVLHIAHLMFILMLSEKCGTSKTCLLHFKSKLRNLYVNYMLMWDLY